MNDIHHNDTLQNDTEQNSAKQNDLGVIIVLAKYNLNFRDNSLELVTYKYFYEIISTKYLTLSTPSVCLWRTHGSKRGGGAGGINGDGKGWVKNKIKTILKNTHPHLLEKKKFIVLILSAESTFLAIDMA